MKIRIKQPSLQLKTRKATFLAFAVFLVLTSIAGTGGIAKYLFLMFAALIIIAIRRFKISTSELIIALPAVAYIIMATVIGLLKDNLNYFSFKQFCFLIAPVIIAIALFDWLARLKVDLPVLQFWAIITVNFIYQGGKIIMQGYAESQYAFIYGAYVICFFYRKAYRYTFLAFFMLMIANKRIALGGCIVVLIVLIAYEKLKNKEIKKYVLRILGCSILILSYATVCSVKTGALAQLCSRWGINTSGRNTMWGIISDYFEFNMRYFGKGLGYVLDLLDSFNRATFSLLHCDVLLAYIELGFWGFAIWFIAHIIMCRQLAKTSKTELDFKKLAIVMMLFAYTMFNYTTDNIIIYINYWFPLNMLLLSIANEKPNNVSLK